MKIKDFTVKYRSLIIQFYFISFIFNLLFLFGETFLYPGVFRITYTLPLLIFVCAGLLFCFSEIRVWIFEINKIYRFIYYFNIAFFGLITIIYFYLYFLENTNYPNYVFTRFHVHYYHLPNVIILAGLFMVFLAVVVHKTTFYSKYFYRLGILRSALIVLSILLLINNFFNTLPKLLDEINLTYNNFDLSYDEKMRARWGDFYDYMIFVKDNTPEDAVIYHPPQINPWQLEGNQVLLRYFLYPRILISGLIDFSDYEGPPITHALIVWGRDLGDGSSEFGWPKGSLYGEKILIFNKGMFENKLYEHGDRLFKGERGIIFL
jgi:hypothetical protein